MSQYNIVIVGGGLSGLIAATSLEEYSVTILDKGYGIGGRLASRNLKDDGKILGFFDYGVQYFKAQDSEFQSWVNDLMEQGIVTDWSQDTHPHKGNTSSNLLAYRGLKSNRAIAQHLAHSFNVINQTRVERLIGSDTGWTLESTDGQEFHADAVILTAPVPQSLEILAQSHLTISPEMRSRLAQITYAPCLSLMAVFDQPSSLPEPGGLQITDPGSPLYWVASNHIKGISPEGYAVTILAKPDFSERCWDKNPDQITAEMLAASQDWIHSNAAIATRLHRWKYSYPMTVFGEHSAVIEAPSPLILAGDAFCPTATTDISLNLEQAYLSGRDAARVLKSMENRIEPLS